MAVRRVSDRAGHRSTSCVCARFSDLAGLFGWSDLEHEAHFSRQGEGYCHEVVVYPGLCSGGEPSAPWEPLAA